MAFGVVGFLGQQQMIEQAIGFVGGVEGRKHAALRITAINALVGRGNGWAVVGQTASDAGKGVAESGVAAFGNLAQALRVATLDQNGVKARERPDVIG